MIIVAIIVAIILIILVIVIEGYLKNSIYVKGKVGEKEVANVLTNINGYNRIINNILINDNGKSRQIDHIAITEYGVFVIETKNYKGVIYGDAKHNEWTQYINRKGYKFNNPIHQNYAHVKVVAGILNISEENIYNVVVFTSNSRLKVKKQNDIIIHTNKLIETITKKDKIFKTFDIDKSYHDLLENRITNQEIIKEHNEDVKHYVEYKNELAESGTCPRCYGELIKRKGRKGYFMGCSNYPKCKYTMEIIEEKASI